MHSPRLLPAALIAAAMIAAAPAHAQQWGAPLFSSPFDRPKFEIMTFDANGAGMGVGASVRPFARVPDLRLRAGIMDGVGTGPFNDPRTPPSPDRMRTAYMAGVDYSLALSPSAGGPVRASLVTGIGVGVNESTVVSAPIGISIGYDGGWIRPYVTPRVVLEHHSSTPYPYQEGLHASAVVDWGVDVDLPIGGTLRAALTTGSYKGIGIGFSF